MTEKIDLKKTWKDLYNPSKKEPLIVDIPAFNFLKVDGHGDPNTSQEFKDAVSSLYPLAYALKFAVKKRQGIDYAVMPLEGLWWCEDMKNFSTDDKSKWDWILMILQPEWVTSDLVNEIHQEVKQKKNPPKIDQIRFEEYHEGLAVCLMHLGPFAEEGPKIQRMHKYAENQGYKITGKHHEIYLNDFTKTAPENLKTILRQPIRK